MTVDKIELPLEPASENAESYKIGDAQQVNELRRDLRPSHVFMFSIACSIGTGLVIGSGQALARGGPGSSLLGYVIIGSVVFSVMTALGEMATFLPMNKGFGGYATRMVDPALGFATGWNYFFKYIIAAPTNLTAAGLVIEYWRPDLNVAIWIAVFGVVVVTINLFNVRVFGEIEFWAGGIKVCIMIILILTCFIVAVGGGPNHHVSGFGYWNSPGAFAEYILTGPKGRLLGWWACIRQACFAFTGTEVVGMTFGEMSDPRKNVPRAVKQTFWRIFSFYILGILVLGMALPYDSSDLLSATTSSTSADASPFVVAIRNAGIKVLPDFTNASLLVFTLSAASSDIYCASRSLYGLSRDRQAPAIFSKTVGKGIPIFATSISAAFIAIGFMNASKSSSSVFDDLVSLVTVFAGLNWLAILVSHIGFRRGLARQNIAVSELPYVGILQPYASYYSLAVTMTVLFFNGYNAFIPHFKIDIFILSYLGILLFILNILLWKFWKKTKRVRGSTMDLVTGRRDD
ncbi:hypothetical protein N7481_008398 [Penicillium waksmanii]|uniref:uncharacterized protein n=1 Tax=Penicillium waksmanii TaxID=69791 RepID=UPI00254937CC|nr:uncharacterized protein N7481_008398 [Penicillium waksmanii]KAJ5981100.1 hypothetical protein N7481_008398 [Penicillium waksmanii]